MQRREFLWLASGTAIAADLPGKGWKPLFNGKTLAGWTAQDSKPQEWTVADNLLGNGSKGKLHNIVSDKQFGDVELFVEFQIPASSNSGIYLQGLYEVQIFDSFGKEKLTAQDGGAIYHRWIEEKPVGGSIPKVNASKKPGEWQSYQIAFRAPRFDAVGKKTNDAKFLRVIYNGQLVQENISCAGPTRSAMNLPEAAKGPLMVQGDHGPVKFRSIAWRALKT